MTERHEAIAAYLDKDTMEFPKGMYPLNELRPIANACEPLSTLPAAMGRHVASIHLELAQSLAAQSDIAGQNTIYRHVEKARQAGDIGSRDEVHPLRSMQSMLLGHSAGVYFNEILGRSDRPNTVSTQAWRQTVKASLEKAYSLHNPEDSDVNFIRTLALLGILHHQEIGPDSPVACLAPTRFSESPESISRFDLLRFDPTKRTCEPIHIADQGTIFHLRVRPEILAPDLYPDPKKNLGVVRALLDHFADDTKRRKKAQRPGPITKPKPPHRATVTVARIAEILEASFDDQIAHRQAVLAQRELDIPTELPENWYELLDPMEEPQAGPRGIALFDLALSQKHIEYSQDLMGPLEIHEFAWMYAERAIGNVRWRQAEQTDVVLDLETAEDLLAKLVKPAKKKHKEYLDRCTLGSKYGLQHDLEAIRFYKELIASGDAQAATQHYQERLAPIAAQALADYDNPHVANKEKASLAGVLHTLSISLLTPVEFGVALPATLRQRNHSERVAWNMTLHTDEEGGYSLGRRLRIIAQPEANDKSLAGKNILTVGFTGISTTRAEAVETDCDFIPLRHVLGHQENEVASEEATEKLLSKIEQLRPV